MALSVNPTRTRTIENNWLISINRRWRKYKKSTTEKLVAMNSSGIIANAESDPFTLDPSRQRIYMAFVEQEIQRLLLGTDEAPNWQAEYQALSYQRGLESTRSKLFAQRAEIAPTETEMLEAQGLKPFTVAPTLTTAMPGADNIHRDGLEFLWQRSYSDLKGWTDKLAKETRQILFDGFQQGQGVDKIVRDMSKRADVSRSRARVIAQTEINQAYSRATIAETDRASSEIGKTIKLRWLTVRDSRVRHEHAAVHGIVMETSRAHEIKKTDGVNCRCALAPVIPRADTAAKRAKFKDEREILLSLGTKKRRSR